MQQLSTFDQPRASRACVRCRVSHLKCQNDGHTPCRGCGRVGAECKFLPTRKERALARKQRSRGALEPHTEGRSVSSDISEYQPAVDLMMRRSGAATARNPADSGPCDLSTGSRDRGGDLEFLYNPQLLSKAIDLFFQHFYADVLFSLHEPSVRLAAKSGELKPILAVAILALTARFMPELAEIYGSGQETCDHFANAIRAELLLEADKPSLEKIHALLFLSLHEWGSGRGARAWIYIGACIRSALLLRTFRKQTPLAPPFNKPLETREELIVEESRIRVFCSMILMEQFMMGKHRSRTRYDENTSIGKPSFEENFLWGTVPNSLAEPLSSREPAQAACGPHSSEKACLAAAVENWNDVNRWVSSGGAKQERELPWAHSSRFNQLREQLQLWEANLPLKLRYNQSAFMIHHVNKQAGPYGFLHLVHCTSVIFLHREYLQFFPDRRKPYIGRLPPQLDFQEGKPSPRPDESFSASMRDIFWTASLHELFTAAHRVTQILNELDSLNAFMNTPFVGFAAFTAATMNIYLSIFHWVCSELAPNALERAETDVRYVKRVLAVWPLARQWYATILRLYDSYKLLHMSERSPQSPTEHVARAFHSFDRTLIDYGEIKPGPEDMAAIRRAAKTGQSHNPGNSEVTMHAPWPTGTEARFLIPQDIEGSVDIEQDQYWDDITEEFIGLMTNID